MGPCQVIEGVEEMQGACGADAATVAARNFVRMVAGGASAHSDHGRGIAEVFYHTAKGEGPYKITDEHKVRLLAHCFGLDPKKDIKELAIEVGEKALQIFGQQHGEIPFLKRAPEKRQAIWRELGIAPRGVDREVVEI
jgi:carbon-monoxide dehydrogenase catalytic subunit